MGYKHANIWMIYKEAEKFRIKLTVEAADTEPLTPSA
jgi:hypothetical protein